MNLVTQIRQASGSEKIKLLMKFKKLKGSEKVKLLIEARKEDDNSTDYSSQIKELWSIDDGADLLGKLEELANKIKDDNQFDTYESELDNLADKATELLLEEEK